MTRQNMVFPKKFMWGASISAHQAEGGNHNQWSVWELENAKSLAAQAPYQYGELPNWPDIKRLATLPANYVSGRAADHYQRYESDFGLLKQLNCNTLRFSIEWSRVEPEQGQWSSEAIEYYRTYLKTLSDKGITPVVTLFHFTLPVWFAGLGGFEKRSNVKYFERYVEKIITELGTHFRYIITINEPTVYASQSYLLGVWPPGVQSKRTMLRVLNNLIVAHNRVSKHIRGVSRKYQVSMAYHVSHIYAGDDARLSELSAKSANAAVNHYVLRRTIKTCTFIGLNYYFSDRIYGYRRHNPETPSSDMGWYMQPSDIRYVLEELSDRYDKPILITENGVADMHDEHRLWWLGETITAIHRAMADGVKCLGYLHWSLLDNFEWDKGRWPRFGLYRVNYATMERTPRPSAKALAGTIRRLTSK